MGGLLTTCVAPGGHPYLNAKEKTYVRLSWDQLKREKPNFGAEILAQPICQGISFGLAAGILAADRRAKAALSPGLDRLVELIELVVVELNLDKSRVKSACEAFATNVIIGSGRLSLSTTGVIFSLIVAYLKSNTNVRLPMGSDADHNGFYSVVLAERPSSLSEAKANREATESWQKLCRFSLACMSETVEAHMKQQEEVKLAADIAAGRQSRTSSILHRRRQSTRTQMHQGSNGAA